jgi:hypothetical protein
MGESYRPLGQSAQPRVEPAVPVGVGADAPLQHVELGAGSAISCYRRSSQRSPALLLAETVDELHWNVHIDAFKRLHLAIGLNSIFQYDDRGCATVDYTLSSFEHISWSAMYGPISFSAFPPLLSGSAFYVSRALVQFKLDRVECLLETLDNANRFNRIHDTFAFLLIDGLFQQIYFVYKVCM